jgi:mannose-1-phosphate guanylyltransferase
MKIIIFAGGSGTRLWPLSKTKLPKQFKKMFDGKSTIQMAVERVENVFGTHNIFISTNEKYIDLVKQQLPQIPNSNIIAEPEKRDVAAAIGFNFFKLKNLGYSGPVVILWSDHLMENVDSFINALKTGEKLVSEDNNRFVFLGETPKYPENNLGWIKASKKINDNIYQFEALKYKPEPKLCEQMFKEGKSFWNPGYWVVHTDFVLDKFKTLQPKMYETLTTMAKSFGTVNESKVVNELYPTLESLSFDKAILELIDPNEAVVIKTDMGWSDPGTLFALKKSLVPSDKENYTLGNVVAKDTTDSLLYNEQDKKLLVTIGLDKFVVVNTKEALLVVNKDNVVNISSLIKKLKTDNKYKDFI